VAPGLLGSGRPSPVRVTLMSAAFATDLRLTLRNLLRKPAFFAHAVLTLALGVGCVSAIYTVVAGTLLRPLPYPQAERIIRIDRVQAPFSGPVSRQLLDDWRAGTEDVFDAVAGFYADTVNLTGNGEAERLTANRVTPTFWTVLGLPAALGRYFDEAEERSNERVAVLSHALWQRRFAADPSIVGRDIHLNGEAYRVIAVTLPAFRYPAGTDVYLPTYLPASGSPRGSNYLSAVARLAEGASPAQASAALQRTNAALAEQYPDDHAGLSAQLTPLAERLNSRVREPLLLLFAAALLVLLIACANLANLLLARASQRQRELAVRAALGAGRVSLARAVLAEAIWIALSGGLLGIGCATLMLPILLASAPGLLPAHAETSLDAAIFAQSLALTAVTALLFALWPAWRAANSAPAEVLQESGRSGSGGRRSTRGRAVLVVAEVALSLTLLVGAGLLIESLRRLAAVDPGIRTESILTAAVVLTLPAQQPGEAEDQRYLRISRSNAATLDALLERIAAMPGVQRVAVSDGLPLAGHNNTNSNVTVIGSDAPADGAEAPWAQWRFVNPDYFATFDIALRQGRLLGAQDRTGDIPGNILVNEEFARRYLGGAEPVGREVEFLFGRKTIVGVVADTRLYGLDSKPLPEVFMPLGYAFQNQFYLALHVQGEPMAFAEALRRILRDFDPAMPVLEVRSMDALLAANNEMRQFNLRLMLIFAGLAVLLAALGLYAVIAYAVAQRRHEFGIRMSLGADAKRVLRDVLGQGMRLAAIGIALGLVGAVLLGRLLSSQLFGVGAVEPIVLLGTAALLACVAVIACGLPALRATRVDPMVALRAQ